MANFYIDTPELKHHLNHPLMKRIVDLKERNYADRENYEYAPVDFEDAMDSYDKVLEIVVISLRPTPKVLITKALPLPTVG
jgi:hypothetical protein